VTGGDRPAGLNELAWSAATLPDGRYVLVVTAAADGRSVRKATDVVIDRTLTELQASTPLLSPNGDGIDDTVSATFVLAQAVPVRVDVLEAGVVLATVFQGTLGAGPQTITWDGSANGAPLADGDYQLAFTVSDALGDVEQTLPVTIEG